MKKRRIKKSSKFKRSQRYASDIPKFGELLRPTTLRRERRFLHETNIVDDQRFYRPYNQNTPRRVDGNKVSFKATRSNKKGAHTTSSDKDRLSFANPKRTITCIKRKRRRVSLFAKGKIGKGRRGSSIRRLTRDSHIKC